jgi:hypothetical protein
MFDKNEYKDMFRRYALSNRNHGEAEALEFCRQMMPAEAMVANYWLIESCMQWFRWIKTQNSDLKFSGSSEEAETH